ncbi:MAG: Sulfate transporter CysZ [Turneriella sp.]|nr:Sulfate transporter CysZ [Turneriella sp.]
MFERIGRGFSFPLQGINYITQHKLWGSMVLPILLTAVLLALLVFLFWFFLFSQIGTWLQIDPTNWFFLLRWFYNIFAFVFKVVVFYYLLSLSLIIYFGLFGIVVGPFLTPVIEKILRAENIPVIQLTFAQQIASILAILWQTVKTLLFQGVLSLLFLLTGPLQPVLNFGFSSYFLGRDNFFLVFELIGMPNEFKTRIKEFRPEATGLGAFSTVFVFIPILGALFAPLLTAVAATRLYIQKKKSK